MKCWFSHKWEVVAQRFGTAEMSICGKSMGERNVRAVISKCSKCGKKKAELI